MEAQLVPVPDIATLDHLFAASHAAPVLLFLHDQGCHLSRDAYEQMGHVPGEIRVVAVDRQQTLAHEIEARTGLRHQSPQVIILRHGRGVWSASHAAITTEAVVDAVRHAEPGAGG